MPAATSRILVKGPRAPRRIVRSKGEPGAFFRETKLAKRDEPMVYDGHCAGECGELASECTCDEASADD